jgi:hypothetical protein
MPKNVHLICRFIRLWIEQRLVTFEMQILVDMFIGNNLVQISYFVIRYAICHMSLNFCASKPDV